MPVIEPAMRSTLPLPVGSADALPLAIHAHARVCQPTGWQRPANVLYGATIALFPMTDSVTKRHQPPSAPFPLYLEKSMKCLVRKACRRCALLLTLLPSVVLAQTVYEPFDYVAGSSMNGLEATGHGLEGHYTGPPVGDLQISSPTLNYGNLSGATPGVAGNKLTDIGMGGAATVTVAVDQDIVVAPGQQLFFSALFTLDDTGNHVPYAWIDLIDDASGGRLGFGEPVAGSRAIRVSADTASTGGLVSASKDNAFVDGQTWWLIGRYFNSALPGQDSLQLVGYDTSQFEPVATAFDLSDPNADLALSIDGIDINLQTISTIAFSIRGADNNFIDELRIGSTFPSAVPEPSTTLLLLAGIGLGLGAGQRRISQARAAPER